MHPWGIRARQVPGRHGGQAVIGAAVAILALVVLNVGTWVYWSVRVQRQDGKIRELRSSQDDLRDIVLGLPRGT